MKKSPLITVFTPNYNNSSYISETIESILNQDYSNLEYIIIDDCSTDGSWEIIKNYASKDRRIRIYRNKKNQGIVKTRNKGFKKKSPQSKYFAIIDSDDISLKNRLALQIDFLEKNEEYGLVGSNIIIINKDSKVIGYRKYPSRDEDIRKVITRYDSFAQPSVTLRTVAIDQTGLYDESFEVSQDYDYWLRVGINWKLANLEQPLIKYRVSKNQVKFTHLKTIIKNTYLIQNRAINSYNYQDYLFNKIIRHLVFLFFLCPKLLYIIYYFIMKINQFKICVKLK